MTLASQGGIPRGLRIAQGHALDDGATCGLAARHEAAPAKGLSPRPTLAGLGPSGDR